LPSEKMTFKGKVKWCRPDQTNEWGKFSTRFYPVAEDLERMKKLPVKNEWKSDEDGDFTNISCPESREYRGRKIINRITLTDKDDKPYYTDLNGFIGDGSDVELGADFYDHPIKGSMRRGNAIKWTSLKILNLAPAYNPDQELNSRPDWGEKPMPVTYA